MTSSPDHVDHHTAPVSNLTYLHKQQSKGHKVHDTPQPRGRNTTRYELGRRHRGGDKVTRIYPNMYVVTPLQAPSPSPPSYLPAGQPVSLPVGTKAAMEVVAALVCFKQN